MDLGDFETVFFRQATFEGLIDSDSYADDEFVSDFAANFLKHHKSESQAVLKRPAELVIAPVPCR